MKRATTVVLLLLTFSTCCGDPAPAGQQAAKKPADKPAIAPATDAGQAAPPAAVQPPAETSFTGETSIETDGGVAGSGEVSLTIAAAKTVTGSITLGEDRHELTGLLDDNFVRCWVRGGADASVRRGYLIGEALAGDGAGFKGSFALSGPGGLSQAKGTWKVGPVKPQ